MRHRRVIIGLAILAAICCAGCGKSPPTLSGGKPVGHWIEALRNPDAKVRKKAAFKLGNVGSADPTALPALLAALDDRDAAVRREAILAVVKFGPDAVEAIPRVTNMQRGDRDARVRVYAAKAATTLAANRGEH